MRGALNSIKVHAYISKPNCPALGYVPVEFPLSKADYEDTLSQLIEIGVGTPLEKDCHPTNIQGGPRILQNLHLDPVNIDEFDYLIKRLDSFSEDELSQFQATAHHLKLQEVKDLINLTYCCQQATVISDFSDLERIGKRHYLTLMGGSAPISDFENIDGEATAQSLISNGTPIVTPYGVLYENQMNLEPVYNGITFPLYQYGSEPLTLEVSSQKGLTYLYLPMPDLQLNRHLLRGDIMDASPCYQIIENALPASVCYIVERGWDSIHDLNRLCEALSVLDKGEFSKLDGAISVAQPDRAEEIVELIQHLDLFEFIPDVRDAEEYGRYMIQESGRFDYDENLEDFYDYTGYGQHRIEQEHGIFTYYGYVSYNGTLSLQELMAGDSPEQDIQFTSM